MADLDVNVLRSFSDRMAAKYEAAQQYAYCPSSEPYRRLMKEAREAKRGLDACYDAAGVTTVSTARSCHSEEARSNAGAMPNASASPADGNRRAGCPNAAHMGEHACKDRSQCWEPCGELGKGAEHAKPASPELTAQINSALGVDLPDGAKR